jgi:predicted transcriptional regulator
MRIDKQKLQIAMANACLTTVELQQAANMPRPTLNNAITGRGVRPVTIGKIAKALNVPVENLIDMEGGV